MEPTVTQDHGILYECFQKVRRHFYTQIDPHIHAAAYRTTDQKWYAEPEFAGKYLDLCAYYAQSEQNAQALANGQIVTAAILSQQRADGYLGCLAPGMERVNFSVWNHSFTLYGLTRMYEATHDRTLLTAAEKAADWLLHTFANCAEPDILYALNQGSQHLCSIFAMAYLHRVTQNPAYADYIRRILAYCETTDMNLLSFDDILHLRSKKGIEMLVIYLGVLAFGVQTNDTRAISAARRYFTQVDQTQIRNTGNATIGEFFTENGNAPRFLPTEEKPNETCVAVGFMELALALFFAEPNAQFLCALEKTLYNHLLGSFDREGKDFAYYQGNYGKKIFQTEKGAYRCCRYRGFTIFSYLKSYLYHTDGTTVTPLLYTPSVYTSDTLTLTQETDYPRTDTVSFTAICQTPHTLRLFLPTWCRSYTLQINQTPVSLSPSAGFLSLSLPKGKTAVNLRFAMPLERQDCIIDGTPYVSFSRGPLLLALDTHFGNRLTDPVQPNAPVQSDPPGTDCLVHERIGNLHLIDYASAGSLSPAQDEYTVFLRKANQP